MNDSVSELERAVGVLREGGLVAFPTETVYGLGADASNERAVRRIFDAKGRPADHPLIVHLPSAEQLDRWAEGIPEVAYVLAETFWPGPLTLILRRRVGVLDVVTGAQETVGLRVPGHKLALELLEAFGGGLAAPSANRFGRISPTTAAHVRSELGDKVDLILDGGPCEVGLESTILDLSAGPPRLLRPGAVAVEALQEVLGQRVVRGPQRYRGAQPPRVPGSLSSHYAPATDAVLVVDAEAYALSHAGEALAVLSRRASPVSFSLPAKDGFKGGSFEDGSSKDQFKNKDAPDPTGDAVLPGVWLTLPDAPDAYGRLLYAALRELDAAGCRRIVVEAPPQTPAWSAVSDRLRRATTPIPVDDL